MKATSTVYLTADRKRAVAEGDKDARFLLVRAGGEIEEVQFEKYEGAAALIGSKKAAPKHDPIQTRDPKTQHRDPK